MCTPLVSETISPVHVTDDAAACPKVWVAALVNTHCERAVADKLERLSIECFVAVQEEMHHWSDRWKKVLRVVIPNVVFVFVESARFNELKRLSFIRGLMSLPGTRQPATIPVQQMQMLKFMLQQSDTPVSLGGEEMRSMKIGEQVRIIRGPLKNVEGEIYRLSNNELHVGISICELGLAHALVKASDIEVIRK